VSAPVPAAIEQQASDRLAQPKKKAKSKTQAQITFASGFFIHVLL
jgi:hypothetical protein